MQCQYGDAVRNVYAVLIVVPQFSGLWLYFQGVLYTDTLYTIARAIMSSSQLKSTFPLIECDDCFANNESEMFYCP